MAEFFVGEIRMFAGNFAPLGWAFCNGQVLSISQNEILYVLIGTTYGGNGVNTFALPDMRGRLPIHQGQGPGLTNRLHGSSGGAETVTLSVSQIPAHTHSFFASNADANTTTPSDTHLASTPEVNLYYSEAPDKTMSSNAITPAGGSQSHTNMQPYLCLNFIIAIEGVFPTQS